MLATGLALITLVATPGLALSQSGYAHGPDHCYYFVAPAGWQLDNRAAAADGVPMVFYPLGASWQSAEVAMYTRPAPRLRPGADAIKAQVDNVIAMYGAAAEAIVAVHAGAVQAESGAQGQLWSFAGYRNGATELAVYFLGRETVNYFVAQIARGASVEEARQTLLELASTYREAGDCQPCEGAASCVHSDGPRR